MILWPENSVKHDRTLTASIKDCSPILLTATQFISVLEPFKIKYSSDCMHYNNKNKQELNAGVCDLF